MPIVEIKTEKTKKITENFLKFRTEIFYNIEKKIKEYYADVFKMMPGDIIIINNSPHNIDLDVRFMNTGIPKKTLHAHLKKIMKSLTRGLPTLYTDSINKLKMTEVAK